MQKFIVIRGPSGSGKTSVATRLLARCSRPAILISEDAIRKMFSDWTEPNHVASKDLAMLAISQGLRSGYDVAYEGISDIVKYKEYFQQIFDLSLSENFFFYLDVSFDETVHRHATRPEKSEFDAETMRQWWGYASPAGFDGEVMVPEQTGLAATVELIGETAGVELIDL